MTTSTAVEQTKTCSKCGVSRPLADYHRRAGAKDGRRSHCKACVSEYHQANRERINAQGREYHAANREKLLAQKAEYYRANREKLLARNAEYRAENREKIAAYREARAPRERDLWLRREYGITSAKFDSMLGQQDGVCAICGSGPRGYDFDRLAVDHDHETGQVRSLLCASCNRSLGLIGDTHLPAAADYLRRTRDIDLRGMAADPAPIPSWLPNGKNNPEHKRDRELRRKYGVDSARYAELLQRQDGVCAITGQLPTASGRDSRLVVDHDHRDGRVRGLLLNSVNRSLGLIGDAHLQTAAAYIEHYSTAVEPGSFRRVVEAVA